jgi:SAM-dependent methyltransferase
MPKIGKGMNASRFLRRSYWRDRLARSVARSRVSGSPDREKLYLQIDRNMQHRGLDNAIIHSHRILSRLWKIAPRNSRVLSVGSCNLLEIYAFKGYGFDDIRGIDLVPADNDRGFVQVMDMHELKFPDNSFDILYCSGAFHCSHDPKRLAGEFVRVTSDGGLVCITVPVNFATSDVYRVDAGSLDGLRKFFEPHVGEVVWEEIVPGGSEHNPNRDQIARTIFRVTKT